MRIRSPLRASVTVPLAWRTNRSDVPADHPVEDIPMDSLGGDPGHPTEETGPVRVHAPQQ